MNRRRFAFFSILLTVLVPFGAASSDRRRVHNDLAVDFPIEGGVMLMGSRMWRLNRVIDVGLVGGAGQINREFDLETASGASLDAETKALILPFVGPQLSFGFHWIGLSLGYAVFWADTDITVKGSSAGTLTGNVKGWGTGFYSPLLVLDFYDSKHDLVFGFGLGGFLGTSYPPLKAGQGSTGVVTDASPIDTLTFHLRLLWADGRWERLKKRTESLDDF